MMSSRALASSLLLLVAAACGSTVEPIFGTGGSSSTGSSHSGTGAGTSVGTSSSASSSMSTSGSVGGASVGTSVSASTGAMSTSSGMTCASFGDACTQCASVACPQIYCGCSQNPDCIALIQCTSKCAGDAACDQMCFTAHPKGISDAFLLSDCGAKDCPAQCPGTMQSSPCTICLLQSCAQEADACVAEPECNVLYKCLSACKPVDLMCQQGCYAQHPNGVAPLQSLLQCAQVPCKQACN